MLKLFTAVSVARDTLASALTVPHGVGVEQLEPEPLREAHEVAENEAVTDKVAHFEGSGDTEELPDGVALIEAEREGKGEREVQSLVLGDGLALKLRVA